tara:strand:+ start:2447 stop:2683 length:237 start_codon:yes stop_codon:yes gene_type:complete
MAQLTEQELSGIKGLIDEFTKAKVQLGDTVISQSNILKKVNDIQLSFAKSEEDLISKYGKDSVINIETGAITTKKEEE